MRVDPMRPTTRLPLIALWLSACRAGGPSVAVPADGPDTATTGDGGGVGGGDTEGGADGGDSGGGDPDVEQVPGRAPGDAVFRDDVVHDLALTLDAAAWDSLIAAPTSYAPATLEIGGRSLAVGVRLKGFSSYQPLTGKPNLRVSFDHTVEGQRYDGLEAIDLVSEVEDPAAMSEAIAYRVFRDAGLPASRTGFGWLEVNGGAYGLYTVVEKKDDVLLAQWWPDDLGGSLYESSSEVWPCDLDDGGDPRCDCWDLDEAGDADARADLEALCAVATDTPDADWYGAISEAVDWGQVSAHMATEMLLDAHDHYAGYMGNVYLAHQAEAAEWSLIPASMNSAFGSTRYAAGSCGASGRTLASFDGGLLARRCWDDAACATQLQGQVRAVAAALAASDVLAQIDLWEALLQPYVAADPKAGYSTDEYATHVACIRAWLEARPAALARELPAECLGEGGDLDVAGWGDLSENGSCDRAEPDIVAFAVESLDGTRVELSASPDGLAPGDEVLLMWMQGAPGDHDGVGAYALADVVSVDSTGVDLATTPDLPLPADPGAWKLQLQRIPRYQDVVVRAGATLTAGAWDGQTGGVLALRVDGTLTVENGGNVSAQGLGYQGGATGAGYNTDGYQGESLEGLGIGGAGGGDYNESNGAWMANLGGGGCNVSGGGGEHAGGATAGASWNGTASAPQPGDVQVGDDGELYMGSGGGGVFYLGGSAGPGGAGGGVLLLWADAVVVEGAGGLSASGAAATSWEAGSWTYGAGGGAGGSVWVEASTMQLGELAVQAVGGAGKSGVDRPGGDGGVGRIWLSCGAVNGVACNDAAFVGLTEP